MSVNDIPRNSFNGMEKRSLPPLALPEYSGPGTSGTGYTNTGAPGITTAEHVQDLDPPPAYDDLFVRRPSPASWENKSNPYNKDDRNAWEIIHEWFELSILQQIIWLGALAFSISYIYYGVKFNGDCYWKTFDKKGKTTGEENLTAFIQAEGGVSCAFVLYIFVWRLWAFCQTRRSKRITRAEVEGQNKCGGLFFFLSIGLFWANFGLCIAGATKIFNLYDSKDTSNGNTYTIQCDSDFYRFYHDAKIGHLAVLMPYVAYVLISFIFMIPIQKKWTLRRKWRQWVRLLDADHDGIISPGDMEKTNAKLEQIRRLVGARQSPLSAEDQRKWWNDHIFKSGPGKPISLHDYTSYLEGCMGSLDKPHDTVNKMKPAITGFFNFFSTDGYRKRNLIIGEEDFVRFWIILTDVDEQHCREMFNKHFPAPVTMAYFLEDFNAFVSHPEFWNEFSNRIFNILKFRRSGCCCEVNI
ncbi:uncharacterized protein LOC125656826 [Ostrea edulis]|uniref:uncharacterized protein LOC125656826 n=1 Tax=Ostrea edulis TaxID=37623 RepID=UPI0024AF26DD|nr:uncharacterized protein LOC125656826 [Ostrea edulis]